MKNSSRISLLQKVGLVSAGVVTGAVIAATGFASAADNTTTTPAPSTQSQQDTRGGTDAPPMARPAEEALTGDVATKVEAAVTAAYPDATIDRMEKDGDGEGVYEAHITKADGTHALVLLDADFTITGEKAGGPHGGPGCDPGHDESGHDKSGHDESGQDGPRHHDSADRGSDASAESPTPQA